MRLPLTSLLALCSALPAACLDTSLPDHQQGLPDAGAQPSPLLVATWPAEGSVGVPDELPRAWVALRADGPLTRIATGWRGPLGVVAHRAEERPCSEMGVDADVCLRLDPLERLVAGRHELGLDEGSLDAQGEALEPAFVTFDVTSIEVDPATPFVSVCERDEETISGFCVLRGDDSLRVRAFLSASAIVELGTGDRMVRSLAERAETVLTLSDLVPSTLYTVRITATSLSGETSVVDTFIRTHPPLARVTITEVLADPIGPDPDQEYVELLNYGDVSLALAGMRLADSPQGLGDLVRSGVQVPPGGRALLVGERFDAVADYGDAPVPPGVPIVRLDGPIASGGLTNSGEPLYLRDAEGRRLSAVPALGAGVEGRCIKRVGDDPRGGELASFVPRAPCTPGGAASGETW